MSVKENKSCILALGMFDGLHSGHMALINQAIALKKKTGLPIVVLTFDKHPLQVIAPSTCPKLLTTVHERARILSFKRIEMMNVIPFNQSIMHMSKHDFLKWIINVFNPRHIIVGYNYTFGMNGEGNNEFLSEQSGQYGYVLSILQPVRVESAPVSSSRVRNLIELGNVNDAGILLLRPYEFTGIVGKGREIGRKMGYPTANICFPSSKVVPCLGVYSALALLDNHSYPCVVNIGYHPTFETNALLAEVHILYEHVNVYQKKLRVKLLAFFRTEHQFASKEELTQQIKNDVAACNRFFIRYK